jgi:ribosomal protein S18 acetylase RimI-like enzyme
LEDLIVKKSKRGLNIGSSLYNEVIKYGNTLGVKRIEWVVLDWNTPAIEFYKKTGAHILDDWKTVQINELSIKKYLETL